MPDLEKVRDHLLNHARSPRNGFLPKQSSHSGEMTNPICGDHVKLSFQIENSVILEAGFSAKACAICSASASLLCEMIPLLSPIEATSKAQFFEDALVSDLDQPWPSAISHLSSFEHLKVNRQRRACALLPWIVLKSILKGASE